MTMSVIDFLFSLIFLPWYFQILLGYVVLTIILEVYIVINYWLTPKYIHRKFGLKHEMIFGLFWFIIIYPFIMDVITYVYRSFFVKLDTKYLDKFKQVSSIFIYEKSGIKIMIIDYKKSKFERPDAYKWFKQHFKHHHGRIELLDHNQYEIPKNRYVMYGDLFKTSLTENDILHVYRTAGEGFKEIYHNPEVEKYNKLMDDIYNNESAMNALNKAMKRMHGD